MKTQSRLMAPLVAVVVGCGGGAARDGGGQVDAAAEQHDDLAQDATMESLPDVLEGPVPDGGCPADVDRMTPPYTPGAFACGTTPDCSTSAHCRSFYVGGPGLGCMLMCVSPDGGVPDAGTCGEGDVIVCDGPEDCPSGTECCEFETTFCASAGFCEAHKFSIVCHTDADCPCSKTCGARHCGRP